MTAHQGLHPETELFLVIPLARWAEYMAPGYPTPLPATTGPQLAVAVGAAFPCLAAAGFLPQPADLSTPTVTAGLLQRDDAAVMAMLRGSSFGLFITLWAPSQPFVGDAMTLLSAARTAGAPVAVFGMFPLAGPDLASALAPLGTAIEGEAAGPLRRQPLNGLELQQALHRVAQQLETRRSLDHTRERADMAWREGRLAAVADYLGVLRRRTLLTPEEEERLRQAEAAATAALAADLEALPEWPERGFARLQRATGRCTRRSNGAA